MRTIPPLGQAIRSKLGETGRSQKDLACGLSVSPNYISLIIRGARAPGWGLLLRLHAELGLDLTSIAQETLAEEEAQYAET